MKSDRVVLNASPLIVLFKANLAHLLPKLFTAVLVPGAVWDEVVAGGPTDMAAQGLPTVDWAKRVEVATVAPAILAWNLGQGESEVLSVASNHPGYRAVIDDSQPGVARARFKCQCLEQAACWCWQNVAA